jgi:hypothetical protein
MVGWRPADYEVYLCGAAHFILLCPGTENKDNVVRSDPYRIPGLNIEFEVQAWTPQFSMTYFPPSFRTWIALREAPLQTWSRSDIIRQFKNLTIQSVLLHMLYLLENSEN